MYRVYAEFDSRSIADRAADRLRSTAPGLGRISIRRKNRSYRSDNADTGTFAAESSLFSPNNFFQNSAFPLTAAFGEGRTLVHERYHEPFDQQEHLLCAEGEREPVERASHLLRAFGGINITVSSSGDE